MGLRHGAQIEEKLVIAENPISVAPNVDPRQEL